MNQKYSPNPARSVSPLRGSTSTKPKYYSSQDVNKIVRNSFEPKIQFLMEQLQERQQTIAKLNNKLNQNDQKLIQQTNLIQNYLRKQKQMPNVQSYVVSTINQIINDKMKQQWEALSSQIKRMSEKLNQKFDQKKLQALIQTQIQKIKEVVTAFIENNKKKSNSYWQKIKDALNKINAKIASNQKDIIDINIKIENFQSLRAKDRETIVELQNSKNVVKNFIQLKKSVENIYQNYQSVLSLQRGFKQRLEQQNGDSLWQADFFKQKKSSNLLPQEVVGLQYSKDEDLLFDVQGNEETKKQEVVPSPIKTINNQSLSVDMVHLHKTTPYGKDQSLFSLNTSENQISSRIQNNTMLINLSLQTRKEMAQGVRERLLQLIQIKNWQRPLQVRYDEQINYLKNAQGNYLFDLKGNMFKINSGELKKLEEEKIVTRHKKEQMGSSKIKLTHC